MQYGARPLRSTRRLENKLGERPTWYRITNAASAAVPTQVSIYDEIGFYGVAAGEFMADLKGVNGDIELHINSPGGDVHDGIAIFNQLKQRSGQIHVIIDGLAASAASFIAQAASPGKLEICPHAQMMVHNGFSMAIGDANDLRKTADLLDDITGEIAAIYAERTGRPVDFWLGQMADETWYTDKAAVAVGLADAIHGQQATAAEWDLSVFAHAPLIINADGNHGPMKGEHSHMHPAYGAQGGDKMHSHPHTHDGDANHGHHKTTVTAPDDGDDTDGASNQLDTVYCPAQYSRGYGETVQCPKCRLFNTTDAKFCDPCGTKLVGRTDVAEVGPGGQLMTGRPGVRNADGPADLGDGWVCDPDGTVRFDPDGDGDDDSTPEGDSDHDYWSADGDQIQDIPDRPEHDGASIGNAAGGDGQEDDEHYPDGTKKPFPGAAPPFKKKKPAADDRSLFPVLNADVDNSPWDASKAWHNGAESDDPAKFYAGICAGRKAGDPSTQAAWALPYKYHPGDPPNAAGVKNALSRLPQTQGLTNAEEAKATLQKAMKVVNPDYDPDAEADLAVDMGLIATVLTIPEPAVDHGGWNPAAALALAAKSGDPAAFYAGICAGRRHGDPATSGAWALPYRYTPGSAPNARAVRAALAELPYLDDLANTAEARAVLDKAMRTISPGTVPDDEIDPGLLEAAFALGLKGAGQ